MQKNDRITVWNLYAINRQRTKKVHIPKLEYKYRAEPKRRLNWIELEMTFDKNVNITYFRLFLNSCIYEISLLYLFHFFCSFFLEQAKKYSDTIQMQIICHWFYLFRLYFAALYYTSSLTWVFTFGLDLLLWCMVYGVWCLCVLCVFFTLSA